VRTLDAVKTIEIGIHPHLHVLGLTIDYDILFSTLLAVAIFCFLGFRMRAKITDGVPGKLQLFWELLVEQVQDLADSAIGPQGRRFVPIGVTLFLFILICNWIGFLPSAMHPGVSGEILPAPTSDVNLPLAMALIVILWAHFEAFRARGFVGYFKHYTQPYAALTPINFVEEITKPITLTFRLFGNLFSGGLMIVVVAALAPLALGPFEIIWKPFDLFIGLIQAFIFMLLTIMYFGMAMSHDDEHDIEHEPHDTAVLETSQ
jgi:F-type H+-transporting ATPase subunit a